MALTTKQRAFVEEYLSNGFNGTAAATSAGYANPRQAASRLLSNVNIRACIDERMATMAMVANEVLARLTDHARASIDDFIDENGDIDVLTARSSQKLHLLKKYSVTERTIKPGITERKVEIELHDPQAALVHLGKHYKLFTDKSEISGKDGGPIDINVVWQDMNPLTSAPNELSEV